MTKCRSSWNAFVYPGGALEVYLCSNFWNLSTTGMEAQAGTVLHEYSHEVAGTEDYEYGTDNCKQLASSNPEEAIDNAASYKYFAASVSAIVRRDDTDERLVMCRTRRGGPRG